MRLQSWLCLAYCVFSRYFHIFLVFVGYLAFHCWCYVGTESVSIFRLSRHINIKPWSDQRVSRVTRLAYIRDMPSSSVGCSRTVYPHEATACLSTSFAIHCSLINLLFDPYVIWATSQPKNDSWCSLWRAYVRFKSKCDSSMRGCGMKAMRRVGVMNVASFVISVDREKWFLLARLCRPGARSRGLNT
jgi:hypothetical protein